ncbi:MAG: ACP S-malonyltransferase [Acidobacteriota bacterium]
MAVRAFLFPGQGSQYAGMGKLLAERFPEAAAVFREADEVLDFPLSRLCFEGPEEELRLTENTQPAILAVSVAVYRVLESRGREPDLVAGHSLGEYSALVAAGSLRFSDALRLVRRRGRFMQEAVPVGVGGMVAVIGLDLPAVVGLCEAAAEGEVVTPANQNAPDQIVVAGHAGALERFSKLAKEAGARRVVPLPVSAPFHCPLMKPAQDKMRPLLEQTAFDDLRFPLVNNYDARRVISGEEAREGLIHQIASMVRWTESLQLMWDLGVREFVEVGPGRVLSGLVKRTLKEAEVRAVETPEQVEDYVSVAR